MVKDYADIVALLDPSKGGRDIDIYYLGDKLKEWSFLREHLAGIPGQAESIDRYGKMGRGDVKELINNLLSLI